MKFRFYAFSTNQINKLFTHGEDSDANRVIEKLVKVDGPSCDATYFFLFYCLGHLIHNTVHTVS